MKLGFLFRSLTTGRFFDLFCLFSTWLPRTEERRVLDSLSAHLSYPLLHTSLTDTEAALLSRSWLTTAAVFCTTPAVPLLCRHMGPTLQRTPPPPAQCPMRTPKFTPVLRSVFLQTLVDVCSPVDFSGRTRGKIVPEFLHFVQISASFILERLTGYKILGSHFLSLQILNMFSFLAQNVAVKLMTILFSFP